MKILLAVVMILTMNPLLHAAKKSKSESKVKLQSKNDKKITDSFVSAMDKNDFERAETIAHTMNKSSLNTRVKFGTTPLIISIISGQENMSKVMIKNGADVNMKDIGGATPLHVAIRMGKTDLVKILLAARAKVNLQDEVGYTPLMRAALKCDANTISLLMSNGSNSADPTIKNRNGEISYDVASHCKNEKIQGMLRVKRIG